MSYLSKLTSLIVKPLILSTDKTLRDEDSGKTIFLNSASGLTVTLPADPRRSGIRYEFIVKTAPTSGDYVITDGSGTILGQIFTTDINAEFDPNFSDSGVQNIKFIQNRSVMTDSVEVVYDGTNWHANCFASRWDGISILTDSKSPSVSPSLSPSASPSVSVSVSPSVSVSISPSISPSAS